MRPDVAAAITAVSTIVLTAVTLAYVLLTSRIASEARRSADAASQAAQAARESVAELRSQREASILPFVGVEELRTSWYGQKLTSVTLRLRNAGNGPAVGVEVEIRGVADKPDEMHGGPFRPDADPLVVLGLGRVECRLTGLSTPVRSQPLHVVVTINYVNVVGKPYRTQEMFSFTQGEAVPLRVHATRLTEGRT